MTRIPLRSIAVAVAIMFLVAESWVLAGPKAPPTGSEPKPTGRGAGTGPVKPGDPSQSRGTPKLGNQAKGVVNGFTAAKDTTSEDDTLVGTLKVQPMEKGAKLLNLRVHRDATYKLGETKLDPEIAVELLWKGLFVSVTFDVEPNEKQKAVPQRALKALAIDAIELEGTVVEMGQDYVILKAKPIKGDWPDAEPPKSGAAAPLVKAAKPRELKLKSLERVTKYLNQDLRATEPEEFTVGQKIEAAAGVGKGKTQGLLLNLHPPINLQTVKPKPTPTPRPPPGKSTKPGG